MTNRGAVVWEGPSRFDGSPIAVVVTWQSRNSKTGNMPQTWIIRTDIAPHEAVRSGADGAICGDCPRRSGNGCYVRVDRAPMMVFRALRRYPRMTPEEAATRLAGKVLRIGAYGDPAAAPESLWWILTARVKGHTGYTHSARLVPGLRRLVMASADSAEQASRYQRDGWRTFRVRAVPDGKPEPLADGEIACPASTEAGAITTCDRCRLCSGARSGDTRKSIAIVDHSPAARRALVPLRRSSVGGAL